ncbi:zinc finger FYVE domain-containing protein 1-like isoform X2 [Sitophilus oryzae]|uniref:Zinc finger FYVE domain-containing protein 1-like isoform X2 n=1 Tax=Sitophilus oryzae TaxID=7048 RepID=A0A6J2YVF5_SITOR|nr:zinc finger FYVE domain-containing protein 1-like isoform X2 [Sitophilus oryzae]
MMGVEVGEPRVTKKLIFFNKLSTNMDNTLASEIKRKHSTISGHSPLVLNSLDPTINNHVCEPEENALEPKKDIPILLQQLDSLNILSDEVDNLGQKSILLLDDTENLRIKSEDAFIKSLNLEPRKKVKVVSIFGNTGEGKSHTLNHVFFNGEDIFKTSSSQVSCTIGVWAKYDTKMNVICLDTEGLLGITKKENQRTRLLLKVLAVSDIIIYRTTAERLQKDMYTFLGGASKAYKDHFSNALHKALIKTDGDKINPGLGPGVIIFHEPKHTNTLDDLHDRASVTQSAEDILRATFADLDLNCDSFSFLKYIGVKKPANGRTPFDRLKFALNKELESTEVRSPRDAKYIYLMLKSINEKYLLPIHDTSPHLYLSQFFTCPEKCQSCHSACTLSMGHQDDGEAHATNQPCKFQHQYQNCVYLCKKCHKNGNKVVVKPSYQTTHENSWTSYFNYVWAGYVIECPKCGEIYRSRQHWYGNKNPEDDAVRLEIVHLWPGERIQFGAYNFAQKVVDQITVISNVVSSVGSEPVKNIRDWTNDKFIAPSYWRPNHEIKACFKCNVSFIPSGSNKILLDKHHCRKCGEGFCDACSSRTCPVPQKGWPDPVRVCDFCYDDLEGRGESLIAGLSGEESAEVRARYLSETVVSSISAVKSLYDKSKDLLKDTIRPSYWTPDSECIECVLCKQPFGPLLSLHHCRDCGKCVCDNCSKSRKAVPLKGWDSPVRVCDTCR